MPYNLDMENIIIHNKTCDMLPSISSTILHVRYSEDANSKSVQSSPIWQYHFPFIVFLLFFSDNDWFTQILQYTDIGTGEIIQLTQLMAPSASDANQKNMGDYITKVYQELLIYPEQNNAQQKNVHTLTRCGLMMPYGDTDLGHHWFRWWLVAWWHQAINWSNSNNIWQLVDFCGIHLRTIELELLKMSSSWNEFENYTFKTTPTSHGTNELTYNTVA